MRNVGSTFQGEREPRGGSFPNTAAAGRQRAARTGERARGGSGGWGGVRGWGRARRTACWKAFGSMPPAVRAGLAAARVTARVRGIHARCRPPAPWARTGRQRPQQGAHECALESGSRWGRRAAARGVALSGGTGRVGRGGGGGDYGETDGRALQSLGERSCERASQSGWERHRQR